MKEIEYISILDKHSEQSDLASSSGIDIQNENWYLNLFGGLAVTTNFCVRLCSYALLCAQLTKRNDTFS